MANTSASKAPKQRPSTRRLSLLRHAKAVEDDGSLSDAQRALNARGREDALKLGEWLRANHAQPDLILCSTSARTRETLAALKVTVPTILSEKAYLASTCDLLALLQDIDDAVHHVMVIGHNPGLHQLIAMLVEDYVREEDREMLIGKFPTCAFASMMLPGQHWRNTKPRTAELDALAIGSKL